MSDTPSPAPDSASKPKLTLTPKAPAAPGSVAAPSEAALPPLESPALQTGVNPGDATPPPLSTAAPRPAALKPTFKLQSTPHPSIAPASPAFKSPMPAALDDSPSIAVVALSFIAAAAALTFAVLLYLKNQ